MKRTLFLILAAGSFFNVGCNPDSTPPKSGTEKPVAVTMDEVKRDASETLKSATAYSQQQKNKLVNDLKAELVIMDAKIAELRNKGSELTSEAKIKWDQKIADLNDKRQVVTEKLTEVQNSTAEAWNDVEKGVQSAWAELKKAFQNASSEF
jgi:hypothetical protein